MREDLAVLELLEQEKQRGVKSREWSKAEKEVEEMMWG
jgi:hypothetical protein